MAAGRRILIIIYICLQVQFNSVQAIQADLQPQELECIEELNLDRAQITVMNKQDLVPEDNPDYSKFITCYYTKMNWVKDEEIDFDTFRKSMEDVVEAGLEGETEQDKQFVRKSVNDAIDKCQNTYTKGDNFETSISKFQNCVMGGLLEKMPST